MILVKVTARVGLRLMDEKAMMECGALLCNCAKNIRVSLWCKALFQFYIHIKLFYEKEFY